MITRFQNDWPQVAWHAQDIANAGAASNVWLVNLHSFPPAACLCLYECSLSSPTTTLTAHHPLFLGQSRMVAAPVRASLQKLKIFNLLSSYFFPPKFHAAFVILHRCLWLSVWDKSLTGAEVSSRPISASSSAWAAAALFLASRFYWGRESCPFSKPAVPPRWRDVFWPSTCDLQSGWEEAVSFDMWHMRFCDVLAPESSCSPFIVWLVTHVNSSGCAIWCCIVTQRCS